MRGRNSQEIRSVCMHFCEVVRFPANRKRNDLYGCNGGARAAPTPLDKCCGAIGAPLVLQLNECEIARPPWLGLASRRALSV